jgi:MATE family multidrug resistance protein
VTALIIVAPALILGAVGVDADVARLAQEHLWGRAWNAIPFGIFAALRCYLQSAGLTRPIVVCTVVANVVNFFADAVLIYGDEALRWVGLPGVGLPAWGVFGAGLASTLAACASLGVLVLAVRAIPAPRDPDRRRRDLPLIRRILALGAPVGLQMLVEVSAFATASVLSGKIGKVAAAGNQIALSLASATFMVPLGISTATAVRVGRAVGMGDRRLARTAGACGFFLSVCFMGAAAIAFNLVPGALARVLTDKEAVVAAAVPLIHIAALFQLCDGFQVVGAGALRGVGDTRTPLVANVVGHFLIGLPVAFFLTFARGLGGPGLWWGLSIGLTIVAVWLSARFAWATARDIARA